MSDRFERGAGSASYEVAGDGIVCASLGGLVVQANAGALSALLLQAASELGATGVLGSVQKALIALPPIDPAHYSYVPPALRAVPVAVVVTPEQAGVYEGIARAAALSGAMRRAFLSRDEAQAWLCEQVRALVANRVWRPVHRPAP